jgi:serine/threonine protein kinase
MNYTLKSKLGEGGMATVFLAEDPKFQADVAIKILNKEFVHNNHIKNRFLAEARSMFRMSHPHVVKVTDLIDEGDTVAFVMEYVEGETLKEYLDRRGALPDNEVSEIFSQMLDAVGYVHEQNLVHRDIKPSNFMIDKKDKVKLMDFGIAKNTDANAFEYTQTGTGMMMGTPMYMSPEQITEAKSVTAQSDIYSLGVVLWQMVTGKKPYDTISLSKFQLQTKIVNESLAQTDTLWDRIIERATLKEVLKRYQSCIELKHVFRSLPIDCVEDAESTHIQFVETNEGVQTEKKPGPVEEILDVPINLNKKIYLKLFGPTLFLLITTKVFPILFDASIIYNIFEVHAISVLLVVILLSLWLTQRMKFFFRKELFNLNMAFFLASSFFVVCAYFYNLYWHGYFVPYYYFWLVWDFFYVPNVIYFYSLFSVIISVISIIKGKK